MLQLSNQFVSISFDEKTGAIVELTNRKTSYSLIHQPELARGLRMLIPLEGCRNHSAPTTLQRLSSYKVLEGKSALLRYDQIVGAKSGQMDISVEIEVILEDSSISSIITVKNQSAYTIEEVSFPCIGGLAGPDGEAPLTARTAQFQGGFNSLTLGDPFPNPDYWGTDWPTLYQTYPSPGMATPFVILDNKLQGAYIGVHGYQPDIVSFVYEYQPGYTDNMHHRLLRDQEMPGVAAGFCISVTRLPFIHPGEKVTLPPVLLNLFEGDWHEGIKPYLKWRETWYQPVKRPNWLVDADCWMTLHINSPEGCCRYTYKELPNILQDAKHAGVKVLQLIGWARGGQDGDEPYQDTDPRLGTQQELKDAISEIESMGIRVLLMCKFKWADQSTAEYKKELEQYTLRDLYGNPVAFGGYGYQTLLQNISGGSRRSGAGLCHLAEGYRAIALREFHKILDLKPSGILYDELANHMLLCFDERHGHRAGASNHVGSLQLAKDFYDAADNDEFLFAGEGPNDVISQYYWGSYIRSDDGNHTPVWKYMNPDMYIATCLTGFDDREIINQSMTYGYAINYEFYNFKGKPSDAPRTVAYAVEAQKLRRKLSDYIWNGRFLHTEGAKITILGDSCEYIYSVFENRKNGKRAIVVSNQSSDTLLQVQVNLEGTSNKFRLYPIGDQEPKWCDGNVQIPMRSLCVLVEE